jgi:hypothetical protein
MSQDAFNDAWELLTAQSEAVEQVEQEQELAKLGDNAQQRIKTIEGFMKNNMSPEDFDVARDLVTTAESVQLIEMLVAATAPTKLPIQGGESPTGVTWADIEAEMFKKHENGQLSQNPEDDARLRWRYATPPDHWLIHKCHSGYNLSTGYPFSKAQ